MPYFLSKLLSGLSSLKVSKLLSAAVGMLGVAICQVAVHHAADYMRSIPLWIFSRSLSASLTLSSMSDTWSDKIDKPGARA